MRTLVLRKSHGAFSAGTPVIVYDRDQRHGMNLCGVRGIELHIHDDDLVVLRSRTDIIWRKKCPSEL